MTRFPHPLVDVHWLHANRAAPDLVLLDASVPPIVPGKPVRGAVSDGRRRAIPGARRFDYDQRVCRPDTPLPHMMPGPELFQDEVRKLGVSRGSAIVVYDDVGLYASPRAWWMFRAMGHRRVAVLEGGLPAWVEQGHDTVDELVAAPAAGDFIARPDPEAFCDCHEVLQALDDPGCCVLDARSPGRFAGLEPEPRPNLRGGHMPGSLNLPFPQVLDGGQLKPVEQLRELFGELGTDGKQLIASCGSGITACILALAAWRAGHHRVSVYDGSWAEWGRPGPLPVVRD